MADDASSLVKSLLARKLRAEGIRAICKGESDSNSVGARRASQYLLTIVLLSLALYGSNVLAFGFIASSFALFGILLVFVVLNLTRRLPLINGYLAMLALWIVSAAYSVWSGRASTLLITHLLPFGLVIVGVFAARSLRRALRVPYVVPVGFILILAPLLTEDPWRLAAAQGAYLVLFAGLAALPLLLYAASSLLSVKPIILLSNIDLDRGDDATIPQEVLDGLQSVNVDADSRKLSENEIKGVIADAYVRQFRWDNLFYLSQELEKGFKKRSVRDLLSFVVGAAVGSFVVIYVLSVSAMPRSLASEWSKVVDIPEISLNILGLTLRLPLGPYVSVSGLFTVVAVVGFLAFSATEEKYSKAITNATAGDRARKLFYYGLPYIMLSPSDERYPQPSITSIEATPGREPGTRNQP